LYKHFVNELFRHLEIIKRHKNEQLTLTHTKTLKAFSHRIHASLATLSVKRHQSLSHWAREDLADFTKSMSDTSTGNRS